MTIILSRELARREKALAAREAEVAAFRDQVGDLRRVVQSTLRTVQPANGGRAGGYREKNARGRGERRLSAPRAE